MLIVQWLTHLNKSANSDLDIIFIPISLRYSTNRASVFLEALASRLAELLGDSIQASLINPVDHYRNAVASLLARMPRKDRRCLVIVDGLDEATDGGVDTVILPGNHARGLRFLVSARLTALFDSQRWCAHIGWALEGAQVRHMSVPPLDDIGIRELLDANRLPFTQKESLETASVLAKLTEGDPLLLQLYAQELSEHLGKSERVELATLYKLKPGYGPFFHDWFRRQESAWKDAGHQPDDNRWKAVLAILAAAMGPLRQCDLEILVDRLVGHEVVIDDGVIGLIHRFILNDGISSGYVLAHPRLAAFLRDELLVRGQWIPRARLIFLNWGRDTVKALQEGTKPPEDVPPYLLQFFGQHQVEANAPVASLMELVDSAWLRAWHAFEGGYLGFSQDVERAIRLVAARAVSTESKHAWYFQGVLFLRSLQDVSRVPPDLLVACVEQQVLKVQHALDKLKLMSPDRRARGTAKLRHFAPVEQREALLLEALKYARAISDTLDRVRALADVAQAMENGPSRTAVELEILAALDNSDNMYRWLVGADYAASSLSGWQLEELFRAALRRVGDDSEWYRIEGILEHLPNDLLNRAVRMVCDHQSSLSSNSEDAKHGKDTDTCPHGMALIILFPYLPEEVRCAHWPSVLSAARESSDLWIRTIGLANVYANLPASERPAVADELLESANRADGSLHGRIFCLSRVAKALSLSNSNGRKALEYATDLALRGGGWRLAPIVSLVNGELLDRCFTTALASGSADALNVLAPRLSSDQLEQALWRVGKIEDGPIVELARISLASHLPKNERNSIIESAMTVLFSPGLVELQSYIAETLLLAVPPSLWQTIIPSFLEVFKASLDKRLFALAASKLPKELIPEVLASVIEDGRVRPNCVFALISLAPRLSEADALVGFEAACRLLPDTHSRIQAMCMLAGRVPKKHRRQAVQKSLKVLHEASTANRKSLHAFNFVSGACALVPFVEAKLKAGLIDQALAIAREGEDRGCRIFAPLLPVIESTQRGDIVREALDKQKEHYNDVSGICTLLNIANDTEKKLLFPHLLEALAIEQDETRLATIISVLPLPPDCEVFILDNLPSLIGRAPRTVVLKGIASLATTIARVEGSASIRILLRAVEAVQRCLP
jgi:hypothetical protein